MFNMLNEADVIRIMQEEWSKKITQLNEEAGASLTLQSSSDADSVYHNSIISAGLKVIDKKSKVRYTVISLSSSGVILREPEGSDVSIDRKTFESEFELD